MNVDSRVKLRLSNGKIVVMRWKRWQVFLADLERKSKV
jgi:hypothetical protein